MGMKHWVIWTSALLALACDDKAKDDKAGDGDGVVNEPDAGLAFRCQELTSYYTKRCADHMEIRDDVTACRAIANGLEDPPFEKTRTRAAQICAQAEESCDDLFMCFVDPHGIATHVKDARISGKATVEGEEFTFDARPAWVAITTLSDGRPGDLVALFHHEERPWFFKLHDLAIRAEEDPFVVDAARPIKLENWEDNVEIASGKVTVRAFAIDGAFDVRAVATDNATGEHIDVRVRGEFPKAD